MYHVNHFISWLLGKHHFVDLHFHSPNNQAFIVFHMQEMKWPE